MFFFLAIMGLGRSGEVLPEKCLHLSAPLQYTVIQQGLLKPPSLPSQQEFSDFLSSDMPLLSINRSFRVYSKLSELEEMMA